MNAQRRIRGPAVLLSLALAPACSNVETTRPEQCKGTLNTLFRELEMYPPPTLKVNWGAYDLSERRTTRLSQGPALPEWQPKLTFEQGRQKFLDERSTDRFGRNF